MKQRFSGQVVAVVGATGGLGQAVARAFAAEGATLVLAGRNLPRLEAVAAELGAAIALEVDLTLPDSLQRLGARILARYGRLDIVVNAAGYDVRKALTAHTPDEIARTLAVDLHGPILLTRALVPALVRQGRGRIVHIGGFADGRLAFPYYSVDVAARAGVAAFVESMNRELRSTGVQLTYFSPSASDTEAEQPYHGLWREMGVPIVPREQVARALLDAVATGKQLAIMGGWATGLFAGLNAVWPRLADRLLLNRYSAILRRHLAPGAPTTGAGPSSPGG